jgi:hypothetical protein
MNVKEIVTAYLKENGYDALSNDNDCACSLIDKSLFNYCDCENVYDCEPAYTHTLGEPVCEECENVSQCNFESYDFIMCKHKPIKEAD